MADAIAVPRPRSTDMYSDSFMLYSVAPCYVDYKHKATSESSKMLRMKTATEIRYENLVAIVQSVADGDLTAFVGKGKNWRNMTDKEKKDKRSNLDQILKRRTTMSGTVRSVGDGLAREIEKEFGIEPGWLDNSHGAIAEATVSQFSPQEIAEFVYIYCCSDENGKQYLRAAIEQAKERLSSDIRHKFEDRSASPLRR